MTTMPPIGTFTGHLKFHRPETLNALGRAAIEFAFPGFLALPEPTPEMLDQMQRRREMGADTVSWEDRPHRRYAGDTTLPRGCYFSVCRTDDGDDSGLVAHEMNAYREPEKSGPVAAFDLMSEKARDALRIETGPRHALGIFVKNKSLFVEKNRTVAEEFFDQSALSGSGALLVDIPYQVEYRKIERVIDLRVPYVQEWFFSHFRLGDGEALDKPNGGNVGSFVEMLPTLMSAMRGGNDVTNAVEVWMRTNSVDALIFPSARSNTSVTVNSGKLQDWYGWNLVDYRLATEGPVFTRWIDFSPWDTKVLEGFRILTPPRDSAFAGSWRIEGNEEAQDRHYGVISGY
jgi:hypothetical protein